MRHDSSISTIHYQGEKRLLIYKAHPYDGVHLGGRDLLGSLDGTHDLLLMLKQRQNMVKQNLTCKCIGMAGDCCTYSRTCELQYLLWQVRQHLSTDPIESLHYFSLERKQRERKKEEDQTTRSGLLKEGFIIGNSDYLFVHFNVQPVGHFIVLQKKEGEKDKHYNKLKLYTFWTFYTPTHTGWESFCIQSTMAGHCSKRQSHTPF